MVKSNDFIKKITVTGFEEFFDIITDGTSDSGILRWQNDEDLFAITEHSVHTDKIKYSDCKEGCYYIINFENLIKFDKIYSHNEIFLLSLNDINKLKNNRRNKESIIYNLNIVKVNIQYDPFIPTLLSKYLLENFPINIYNDKIIDLTYKDIANIIINYQKNLNLHNDESIKDFIEKILINLPYIKTLILDQI